jgi:hypothetical protein
MREIAGGIMPGRAEGRHGVNTTFEGGMDPLRAAVATR